MQQPSTLCSAPPDGRVRANALSLLPPGPAAFLQQLAALGLLEPADRESFLTERLDRLRDYATNERLGGALMQAGLLTSYQLERVLRGDTHGLALGGYRIREELGRGGMGTVYLAEHCLMKRRVAVKVVPADEEVHPSVRQRFYSEMRVLAELSHPHIVMALDAGELPASGRNPGLVYMVLELVQGGDLERLVLRRGRCGVAQACRYVRDAAAGLQAAHDRHLVHRDLKPSNLLLAASGQVKVVDFGLARQFSSQLTDPRALLGSIEFMPPEQSHDPSSVGKEADIYGLGATLFWLLTGEGPYPYAANAVQGLRLLQQQPPRRLLQMRPDAPPELDDLVARLLARDPAERPSSPLAVMNALRPFLLGSAVSCGGLAGASLPRALVVGDAHEAPAHRAALEQAGCVCDQAADGPSALEAAARARYDLVVLGRTLPEAQGADVRRRLLDRADNPNVKILSADEAGQARPALDVKAAQDRAGLLAEQLLAVTRQLEQNMQARQAEVTAAHDALLFAMARVAESRDGETPGHLERMRRYTRALAVEAAKAPPWQGLVDERFLRTLERCVPLHDIGKIGLSDELLLKPASLTPSERGVVQTHAVLGDQILESLSAEHGAGLEFLGTARAIVRHHHERWDGKGYPDRLVGDSIPPAARLVAVADVYDALRRMRMYKPAMPHQTVIHLMVHRSEGQFDPSLVQALERCQGEFERIYREVEE